MKNIAVLGCGPTGLLIAHAVLQAGHQPVVISDKVKSEIPGSQHLHGPVPGLTSPYPEGTIQFVRLGTEQNYAQKVYGDPSRSTGWGNYFQVFPSWNVVKAYETLWSRFGSEVVDFKIKTDDVQEIVNSYDMVISTLPQWSLCDVHEHIFESVPYFIKTLPTPPDDENHEIVVYNGLPFDRWYRWSILAGLCSIESTDPVWEDAMEGTKAVTNNCDCHPAVIRLGRWAEWTHGVTMYKSYQRAMTLLEKI